MKRHYYSKSFKDFILDPDTSILGELAKAHSHDLDALQKKAWLDQIQIFKDQLNGIDAGHIFFEFTIPRIGKRVDNVLIIHDAIFVVEFKVGAQGFDRHSVDQLTDYALDLKNFHESSHSLKIVPILISTEASNLPIELNCHDDGVYHPILSNKKNFREVLGAFNFESGMQIDPLAWAQSRYKPTPNIVEAAQALFEGHKVEDITRSDADAINLSLTFECIKRIINESKVSGAKSICFVTGVPGAGKTLAGLNLALQSRNMNESEHAVFLSGNGPLVDVLREALARDEVHRAKILDKKVSKAESYRKSSSFIQNIHHFRDDALVSKTAPIEKVVIFDEAQRAWTANKTRDFMQKKRGVSAFSMSEPEFLISVMDRHSGPCTIVCLIGGGQEINTGEAGIDEWFRSLKKSFPKWRIHYSNQIVSDNNYARDPALIQWIQEFGKEESHLHLGVSLRSYRAEMLSAFVKNLLDLRQAEAREIFFRKLQKYPIVLTRDLDLAKEWLRSKARGTERYGLVASSGASRLRSFGINVSDKIHAANWFLNGKTDVRSSFFLEEVGTEFDVQGLELDWAGVCWDGDLSINESSMWNFRSFSGTTWKNVNQEVDKEYLRNTYRVLLTRARQGMVLFIPFGNENDKTRLPKFYDGTFGYLKSLGLPVLEYKI